MRSKIAEVSGVSGVEDVWMSMCRILKENVNVSIPGKGLIIRIQQHSTVAMMALLAVTLEFTDAGLFLTDADDDHEDLFPSDVDDEGADLLSSFGVEAGMRVGDIVSSSFEIHEGNAGDVDDDSWFSEDDGGWTFVPTRRQEEILFRILRITSGGIRCHL